MKVIGLFFTLFRESVELKIIKALCMNGTCTLRGLARYVGIHHTNLSKYVRRLVDAGLIEQEAIGNMRVIRLKGEYAFISLLLEPCMH